METTVTLTVSASEARRIPRAVEARRDYWSSPDMRDRHQDAQSVSNTYRDTADMLETQMASQGVKP